MEILYQSCCGLDVHKKMIVACLRRTSEVGKVDKQVRTFGTTTSELLSLSDWLVEAGCTHVAMEATGVYWKPVYNILEGQMELLVVNARRIQSGAGTQDRCQRRGVVRGAVAARTAESELHSAAVAAGSARPDPLPHDVGPSGRASSTGCRRCWKTPI